MEQKKISLWDAVLLNMNIMIGSGILIGPGKAALISGNASFLTWPIVALLFLPIVLCTIELSRMFPGAGGFYLYAKEGFGQKIGYIAGLIYIIGYTFAASVEVVALRETLINTLYGCGLNTQSMLLTPFVFNALLITVCFLFSCLSLKIVSAFLNSLTLAKMLPLVILIGLLPFLFNPSFTISGAELSALPMSLSMTIFGFFGFEYCTSFSHLIENSEKNAPKAMLIGFLATGLLYMLFHFGLLNVMGADNLACLGAPEFAKFITLPIPYLKALLAFLIPLVSLIIFFAATLGMLNSNAMIMHAMAEANLFKGSSYLTPTTVLARPWATLLLQSIIVFSIATFIPSVTLIGNLCNLAILTAFILPILSLMKVRARRDIRQKFPLTQWALLTVLGLCFYSWYALGNTMSMRFLYSLVFVAALGIGFMFYNKEK